MHTRGRGRDAGRRSPTVDRQSDRPPAPAEIRTLFAIDPAVDLSIEDRTGANRLPDRSVPPDGILFYDRAACGFAGQFPIRVVP